MNLHTLHEKLFQGSVVGFVRIALAVPVYLVLTPWVLHALGPEQFGLWAFSTIVVTLMNLTDLGLKNGLVYHIARHADQPIHARRYFSATLWSYLAIASTFVIGTAVWGERVVPSLLNVPETLRAPTMFVVWVTMAGLAWRLLALPYQAVVEGYQELALSQLIFLLWMGVHFIGTLLALLLAPTIYGLGWAGLIGNMFIFWAFYWTVRRRFPYITPQFGGGLLTTLRSMLGFGLGLQVASLCIAFREPLFKVLIARSADFAAVATFEIVYKLCTQVMSVIITPLLGLFGAAALLSSRREDLAGLLRPLVGWTMGMLLPVTAGVVSFAGPAARGWLGEEGAAAGGLLPLMCTGFSLYYATEALYKMIEGSGGAWYSAAVQAAALATQAAVYWIVAPLNAHAAAWSLSAGFALFSLVNLIVFRFRFPEIRLFTSRQWSALLAPTGAYAIGLALAPHEIRPAMFGVYLAAHTVLLFATGIADADAVGRRLRTTRAGIRWPVALAQKLMK
jgi:O-antigen/teichoic acid export membrane protein